MGEKKINEVMGACRLCHKEAKLLNSHIIPEFVYKPLYDDLHRFISFEPSSQHPNKMKQKGIRERLLCIECEGRFSKLEQYASQVISHKKLDVSDFDEQTRVYTFRNIDYNRFKLFQLSVLWKASVAHKSSFSSVSLGHHEEKLRRMLSQNEPGEPHEYGCAVIGLHSIAGIEMDQVIVEPIKQRKLGHIMYSFLFASCLWTYVVSSHSNQFKNEEVFLQKDGTLPMAVRNPEDIGLLDFLYNRFKKAGALNN